MNECTYKNYDELPLMLNVVQVAAVLGISRAGAYELVHSEGFPALKIGSRIVVPKDKLQEWIDANTTQKRPRCNQRMPRLCN
jgi:excisionase family DNA binding protein